MSYFTFFLNTILRIIFKMLPDDFVQSISDRKLFKFESIKENNNFKSEFISGSASSCARNVTPYLYQFDDAITVMFDQKKRRNIQVVDMKVLTSKLSPVNGANNYVAYLCANEEYLRRYELINVDYTTHKDGVTTLMCAAMSGDVGYLRRLVDCGADVNKQQRSGSTALMEASFFGQTNCVQILLDAGAELNVQNKAGHTALTVTASTNFPEVLALLLKQGSNVNICTKNKISALGLAALNGHLDNVRLLLGEPNVDVLSEDSELFTAACWGVIVNPAIGFYINMELANRKLLLQHIKRRLKLRSQHPQQTNLILAIYHSLPSWCMIRESRHHLLERRTYDTLLDAILVEKRPTMLLRVSAWFPMLLAGFLYYEKDTVHQHLQSKAALWLIDDSENEPLQTKIAPIKLLAQVLFVAATDEGFHHVVNHAVNLEPLWGAIRNRSLFPNERHSASKELSRVTVEQLTVFFRQYGTEIGYAEARKLFSPVLADDIVPKPMTKLNTRIEEMLELLSSVLKAADARIADYNMEKLLKEEVMENQKSIKKRERKKRQRQKRQELEPDNNPSNLQSDILQNNGDASQTKSEETVNESSLPLTSTSVIQKDIEEEGKNMFVPLVSRRQRRLAKKVEHNPTDSSTKPSRPAVPSRSMSQGPINTKSVKQLPKMCPLLKLPSPAPIPTHNAWMLPKKCTDEVKNSSGDGVDDMGVVMQFLKVGGNNAIVNQVNRQTHLPASQSKPCGMVNNQTPENTKSNNEATGMTIPINRQSFDELGNVGKAHVRPTPPHEGQTVNPQTTKTNMVRQTKPTATVNALRHGIMPNSSNFQVPRPQVNPPPYTHVAEPEVMQDFRNRPSDTTTLIGPVNPPLPVRRGQSCHTMRKLMWAPRSLRWQEQLHALSTGPRGRYQIGSIFCCFLDESMIIAKGNHDSVVTVGIRVDGIEVAIKRMCKATGRQIKDDLDQSRCLEMQHENIICYKDYFEDTRFAYLAMELCEYSLEEYIQLLKSRGLLPRKVPTLAQQLLRGLQFLHHANVLHLNLKPRNILIDHRGNVRLADFGYSRHLGKEDTVTNTNAHEGLCWRPREAFLATDGDIPYKPVSDIQVAGMIVHYMVTGGSHPFGDDPVICDINVRLGRLRLQVCDDVLINLLGCMLHPEMERRKTAAQCLGHPYFWSDEKRFLFLQRVGNEPEIRDSIPCSVVNRINNTSHWIGHYDWMSQVDPRLLQTNGLNSGYQSSVTDLLRLMTDVERSSDLQAFTGKPFIYFKAKFSRVFMPTYEIIRESDWPIRRFLKEFFLS